ncbi:MAG: ATP-binding protein [Melioribacteraceae bacterium]|nr:ATP-binding protein [Melioribacteraceae bacterium]
MIKITSTLDYDIHGVKVLVHSPAGGGKTWLCRTAPNNLIISAEAGLLSLADVDIPAIEITKLEQVNDSFRYVTESEEGKKFETISLDSITEIAEIMLIQYKQEESDARQAYGRMNDDMASIIRKFRDLPNRNIYFSAKQTRLVDEDIGTTRYVPSMPGKTMLNSLDYFFDEVLALRIGQLEDGTTYRYLQTYPDINYSAKDRSGKLPLRQKPDLQDVFNRISRKKEDKNGETTPSSEHSGE